MNWSPRRTWKLAFAIRCSEQAKVTKNGTMALLDKLGSFGAIVAATGSYAVGFAILTALSLTAAGLLAYGR